MPKTVQSDTRSRPIVAFRRPRPPGSPAPLEQPVLGGTAEGELSDFLRRYAEREGSSTDYVVHHPLDTARAGRALVGLPTITAELSASVEGEAIRREFSRFRSRRWLLGLSTVLEVPTDASTYSSGSSKQTLRRKTRAARARGIAWHRVDDGDERRRLLELANLHERVNERELYRQTEPDNDDLLDYRLWLVACAADGTPILLSVTPYDGAWATLRYFRTLHGHDDASVARYWMTEVLVEHLSQVGVRYLLDAAVPHWLPNGLRHFQRMLGFRLVRLRFTRSETPAR